MKKSENMRELEYLASSQWGMFTSAQASTLGVRGTQISRMAVAGTVEAMRRGVWRYTIGEETSHPYIKAAWLAAYPASTAAERLGARPHDAVVAGRTAAAIHGIGDLHEDPYTFIVRTRRQTTSNDLTFHLWPLDERDISFVEGLPVTSPERTIADLVRERQDQSHIRQVAVEALAGGIDMTRLKELLGELGGQRTAAVNDLYCLVNQFTLMDDEAVLVEAMGELGRLMMSLSQKGRAPSNKLVEKMSSSLMRFEELSHTVANPGLIHAIEELAESTRTLLAAMETQRQPTQEEPRNDYD